MEKAIKMGLIGKDISYTFSKKYFENKFKNLLLKNHSYEVYDLENIEQVQTVFEKVDLLGFNVTIPYKQKIIPYLDELSDEAAQTGAVNCVQIKNGVKKGFNTDVFGFEKTLLLHQKEHHKSALILGNGGAAKAVQYVLQNHTIPFQIIERNTSNNFETLTVDIVAEHQIFIQCTPVGTFPNTDHCLTFPFEGLNEQALVIDLIYNPSESKFLQKAAKQGAKTVNGLYMLEQQAEKSWQIWNN